MLVYQRVYPDISRYPCRSSSASETVEIPVDPIDLHDAKRHRKPATNSSDAPGARLYEEYLHPYSNLVGYNG